MGRTLKKEKGEGKPSPIFRNMNNLFNTMNNLISNQNDGTFTNIEKPITSFANYGQQMIDTVKNNILENQNTYENKQYMEDSIGKLMDAGAGFTDIVDFIKDKKNESVDKALEEINGPTEDPLQAALQWAEDQQKKEWAREDEIRKETQEREDSALQRWVEDAKKAGINPNIFSGQGAASGGGITSATGLNMSQYETVANKLLTEWETMVNQEFEKNENKKDRFNNIMRSLINLAGLGIIASKKK